MTETSIAVTGVQYTNQKKEEIEMETISTRNIETATFLVVRGNPVVKTTRSGKDVSFCFNDTPKLHQDFDNLNYGDDAVPARQLFSARKRLLDLIFERPFDL